MYQRTLVALILALALPGCVVDAVDDHADGVERPPANAPAKRVTCEPVSAPELLLDQPGKRLYVFTEELDAITFSEQRVQTQAYEEYYDFLADLAVSVGVDTFDQLALLQRQRDVYVMYLGPEEAPRFDALINGDVGEITTIPCLQSMILELQFNDFSPVVDFSEAGAMVLTRSQGGTTLVRTYVLTQTSSLGVSFADVEPLVIADIGQGWELLAAFHNHPFAPDNTIDIAGTTIPSSPDARLFRRLRDELDLQEAWISNGVHSLRLTADEFDASVF